jgi:hypothetical protein
MMVTTSEELLIGGGGGNAISYRVRHKLRKCEKK